MGSRRGMAVQAAARHGSASRGMAQRGKAGASQQVDEAWSGLAEPGMARLGEARLGKAQHGDAGQGGVHPTIYVARSGDARRGSARFGRPWRRQRGVGQGGARLRMGLVARQAGIGVRAPGWHAQQNNAMTNDGQQRVTRRRAHTWR